MSIRGILEKVAHRAGVLWTQIGLLILFLVVLDFLAGLVHKEIHHLRKTHEPAMEEAYGRASWTADYFRVLRHVNMRWFPYIYWKSSPVSSPYLNVDQQGDRITWNKPDQGNNHGRPLTVFTFGGSTMWGYGVRDDYTLPSLIARYLAEKTDYNVQVYNYGQIGFVSSQELLLLYQLLRQGLRPDVVIFYDGINDTYSAYQAGIAGLPANESSRVREFNLVGGNRPRRRRLYLTALHTFLFHTNIARLGKFAREEDKGSEEEPINATEPREILSYMAPLPRHEGPQALEQDIVSTYLFNKQVAEVLGKQYGFQCLFYWQPDIYSKNKLSAFELNFIRGREVREFFQVTYQLMNSVGRQAGVHDISGIFNDKPETYLMDGWHPTEAGNKLIAQTMAGDVEKVLAQIERSRSVKPAPAAAEGSASR